jgi:two-component system nitrogen regulation response regulator NtrX
LARYSWPGNIRELKNFVERVTIMAEGELITPDTVRRYLTLHEERERDEAYRGFEAMKLSEARDEFEREFLLRKLEELGGNISRASVVLGITPSNLHNKIKKYGINVKDLK